MNRRALVALNLVLLVAVGLCLWRVQVNRELAHARQQRFARAAISHEVATTPAAVVAATAAQPVHYAEIAMRSLFSPDRNPHILEEPPTAPAPPRPVPAFPRAYGVMDLGQGPVALLAWGDARQRPYQPSESLGPWRLVSINGERLVFEWIEQGRTFEKTLEDLRVRTTQQQTAAEPEAALKPELKRHDEGLTGDGPGPSTGAYRVCKSGDRAPTGAIVDGYGKTETPTPFGNVCRWEAVSGAGRI